MTKKELLKLLEPIGENDAVVVTRGNVHPSFKIIGVEDSTSIGVWEIRYTDFETKNPWEV